MTESCSYVTLVLARHKYMAMFSYNLLDIEQNSKVFQIKNLAGK